MGTSRTHGERQARRIGDGVSTFRGPLLIRDGYEVPVSLERWSGFVLIVAAHAVEQRYAHAMRDLGISLRDFVMLSEIAARPGLSMTALSQRLGISRSRTSEQLDVLDMAGCVRREMNRYDLRRRNIWITAPGRRELEEARERIDRVDKHLLIPLESRERPWFAAALRRLPPALTGRPLDAI
jgi:DNA-binding MarR family transcriptional regulator